MTLKIKKFKLLKISIILSLLLISINSTFSINPIINISESINLTYLNSNHTKTLIESIGNLTLKNPSNSDIIYDFTIPLKLDSEIKITKLNPKQNFQKFNINTNKIQSQPITPNENIKIEYKIYGIVNYDIKSNSIDKNLSLLEYYAQDFELISNINTKVQNSQTNNSIKIKISNPTNFNYNLSELKIYQTQNSQTKISGNNLIKTFKNINLKPYKEINLNLKTPTKINTSIYSISQKYQINKIINSKIHSIINTNFQNITFPKSPIKKPINKNNLSLNKEISIQKKIEIINKTTTKITISVTNLGPDNLENLIVIDNLNKNQWEIKNLNSQTEWNINYLTSQTLNLDSIPNIFGINNQKVIKTIIYSNQTSTLQEKEPKLIEKVGMIVAVGLLLIYLLF